MKQNDWFLNLRDKISAYAYDKWVEKKKSEGLVYGPERTETTHPHLIPWEELPEDQRWSDHIAAEAAIEYLQSEGLLIGQPDFTEQYRQKAKMETVAIRENQFDVSQFAHYVDEAKYQAAVLAGNAPDILSGRDFNFLINCIVNAYRQYRSVIVFLGGHVIKCGLAPIFNEMLEAEVITHVAMNGAASIHDIEFAMMGHSSEWVKDLLPKGQWGMWQETGEVIHNAIAMAYREQKGMGEILAEATWEMTGDFHKYSILHSCYDNSIPTTIHVAIGCDVIHQHPQACFEHIGATSGRDFYRLMESVIGLNDGGVFINFGSAAMGPEVFSKALNLARNTGHKVENFTTANFDIVELPERLSRTKKNVVTRPHIGSEGKGFNFVGPHEILISLLWHGVMGRI